MKMGKHSNRRQQSGSGRAVLVTLYVTKPRRRDGATAATPPSRAVHHHHHHHHHYLHSEARRRSGKAGGFYDRRADLLEYSRQLRNTAAEDTLPLPPQRDVKTLGAVRRQDGRQLVADDDRRLVRLRLECSGSLQQHSRQRCFGGGWSCNKVFMLVLPCNNNVESMSTRSRKNRRDDKDNYQNNTSNKTKTWPATALQLVSKLKVERKRTSNGNDKGFAKMLYSMFRQ